MDDRFLNAGDRYLVVSDVDGTMLGNDEGLEGLVAWLAPRRERFYLAYNSGRLAASIRASVETTRLPSPDALIGGVGTEIEFFGSGELLAGWPTGGQRWDPAVIRATLAACDALELQPTEFNAAFKISYYAHGASGEELARWQVMLEAAGQGVQLVYSSDRDLDVLPAGIDKGAATARLAQHWQVPPQRVIVCGDTGNDRSMFEQGFRGIVVGNALPELQSLDSPDIYHATGSCAAGVAEGLRHWTAAGSE